MIKLDLGCGARKRPGFIGVDIRLLPGVDVVHDLRNFPYPYPDNSVDEILMDNVIEHFEEPIRIMEEIYRITKNGSKICIFTPYFRSHYAFNDPTHRHFFGVSSFDYYDPSRIYGRLYKYSHATFKIISVEFDKKWEGKWLSPIHRWVELCKSLSRNI